MGCLYDIYIEFLDYTELPIYIIFAFLYNKNVLEIYVFKWNSLILDFEGHSNILQGFNYRTYASLVHNIFSCDFINDKLFENDIQNFLNYFIQSPY